MSLETPNAFADEENILLHTALFKQVSPAEAEELLPHLKHATFDKGDYIFSEGDTDQRMYLLEQGRVKLIRTSSDDRVQLLSIPRAGRSAWRDSGIRPSWWPAHRVRGVHEPWHARGLAGA